MDAAADDGAHRSHRRPFDAHLGQFLHGQYDVELGEVGIGENDPDNPWRDSQAFPRDEAERNVRRHYYAGLRFLSLHGDRLRTRRERCFAFRQ